jgi:PhnB protein
MSDKPSFAPYLVVSYAPAAIDFYKKAFGAVELVRHMVPNSDKVMHSHLVIEGSDVMLSDDCSSFMGAKSETPEALGGSPVTFHLHTDNADALWAKAVAAGATEKMPLMNQFWGDRYGQLRDPFGHYWSIGQTISKPTEAEIEEGAKKGFERAKEVFAH